MAHTNREANLTLEVKRSNVNINHHLSNFGRSPGPEASEEKPFEIINIFSIQMYGAHTNAYRSKLDLAVKRLNVNV